MSIISKLGFGTTMKVGDGGSAEAFEIINGLKDISIDGFDYPSVDTTHHQSGSRTQIAGLRNLGTVTSSLVLDSSDAKQAQLFSDWDAGTVRNYQITLTDNGGQVWDISLYVANITPSAPLEEAVTCSVTFQATAAPVIS